MNKLHSDINEETALILISNEVYKSAVGILESLESQEKIHGNGHHAAQRIAAYAEQVLKDRWIEKNK